MVKDFKTCVVIWHPDFEDPGDGAETAKGFMDNMKQSLVAGLEALSEISGDPTHAEVGRGYVMAVGAVRGVIPQKPPGEMLQ